MAQLHVPAYLSRNLSHSALRGLLVGEASDIGYQGMGRLYDDAADMGIALVNAETGNVTRWGLKEEIRCPREGELLGWMFVPTPETVRKHPQLSSYQLNLIND